MAIEFQTKNEELHRKAFMLHHRLTALLENPSSGISLTAFEADIAASDSETSCLLRSLELQFQAMQATLQALSSVTATRMAR